MPPDSERERLVAEFNAALTDDRVQELREIACDVIPTALAANGQRLSIDAWLSGDSARQGFAVMTEMAAELAMGAAALFRQELWYPGAALVRQLLECGYLISLASDRRDEAEAWFRSSHDEIVRRFTPGTMRQRAARNFRREEYHRHCDLGGHPNPAGRLLLRRHEEWRPISPRSNWVDLAQHLGEIWTWFEEALPLYDPRLDPGGELYAPARGPDQAAEVGNALSNWRQVDPLARRLSTDLLSQRKA